MPRPPSVRIAVGVYKTVSALIAKVQVGTGHRAVQRECRFPLTTPLADIAQWRIDTRGELASSRPPQTRRSLSDAVDRYLDSLNESPARIAIRRANLRQWVVEFGAKRPSQLRARQIEEVIHEWLGDGLARSTIRNRCFELQRMLITVAGNKGAWTPFRNIDLGALLENRDYGRKSQAE